MTQFDLDTMRQRVMEEFDYWAPQLGNGVTILQIDVHTYRKLGDQVRSLGKRDPQHDRELTVLMKSR